MKAFRKFVAAIVGLLISIVLIFIKLDIAKWFDSVFDSAFIPTPSDYSVNGFFMNLYKYVESPINYELGYNNIDINNIDIDEWYMPKITIYCVIWMVIAVVIEFFAERNYEKKIAESDRAFLLNIDMSEELRKKAYSSTALIIVFGLIGVILFDLITSEVAIF